MSLLFDERPVPVHVRTKLGVPLPRISFGAPSKLDEPGGGIEGRTGRCITRGCAQDSSSQSS